MNILFLGYEKSRIIDFLRNRGNDVKATADKLSLEQYCEIDPDLIISHGYRHIIKKPIIEKYYNKIINLHVSYLPWNRGVSPNLWSFVTGTKKGVTIHFINEGIDTGDILFQQEVKFEEDVTLNESYQVLKVTIENLFIKNWTNIEHNQYTAIKQDLNAGSYHNKKETKEILHFLGEKGWDNKSKDVVSLVRQGYINRERIDKGYEAEKK